MNTLKNKKIINSIFEKGKTISSGVVLVKYLESESNGFLFAVSSKKFKRAVDRNRIKRLIKENLRSIKIENKIVAIVYIGEVMPTYESIRLSVSNLVKKL